MFMKRPIIIIYVVLCQRMKVLRTQGKKYGGVYTVYIILLLGIIHLLEVKNKLNGVGWNILCRSTLARFRLEYCCRSMLTRLSELSAVSDVNRYHTSIPGF